MSEPMMDETDALADCLEAIERGERTIASCLEQYPEYAQELVELLPIAAAFTQVPEVASARPPEAAYQRLMDQLRPFPNESVTFLDSLRHHWQCIGLFQLTRRLNMTWILLIATVVSLAAGGGAVYASDAAMPGDPLYSIDLSIEELRLNIASSPEAAAGLQLTFAEERLQEAQELMAKGDSDHYQQALSAYGDNISTVAQTISLGDGVDQEALSNLLEEALAVHDTILATPGAESDEENADEEDEDWDEADSNRCSNMSDHPMAQTIADRYGVSTEEVMDWFCNGAGFGEIMLAYGISEEAGVPVSDLFALRQEGYGWGKLMQNADLIGPPDGAGPPDDAGTPDDETPQGPPDGAGPPDDAGAPDDETPQGPPDDAGRPDDAGPPDHAGRPDKTHQGPPDHAGPPDEDSKGPPEGAGPSEGVGNGQGPPDHAGPPAGRPGGGRP